MADAPKKQVLGVVRLGVFFIIAALALPLGHLTVTGLFAALLWAGAGSLIIGRVIATPQILTGTVITALLLAYSQGLGEAVVSGVSMGGYHASSEGVQFALLGIIVHVLVILIVGWVVGRALRSPSNDVTGARSFPLELAIVIFLGLCFIAAFSSGTLTFWGASTSAPSTEGNAIRLELFYGPTLLAALGYGCFARVDAPRARVPVWQLIAFGVIAVLLFVLQSRRLMIAGALILALTQIAATPRELWRRLVMRLAGLAAVMVGFALASAGWRDVEEWESVNLGGRFERAIGAFSDTRALETIESRLTYLWFDATVQDMTLAGADVDGVDLLASEVARALPRVILPSKNDVPTVTCETALDDFGLPEDLPCTPTGEGLLMGGWLGVIIAASLVGLVLGVAEVLVARGPGLGRVFGMFLIFPSVMLESGVFSIVPSLRLGLIGVSFIALIYVALRLFAVRRARRKVGEVQG